VLKEGQPGQIRVRISGLPAPQVQWYMNSTPIAGATNSILILPNVTRSMEGSYWLAASNVLGQATSAPIAALVSNVNPNRFVTLRWAGRRDGGLTLQSTDQLKPGAVWNDLSNYPPSAAEQSYVELSAGAAGFYRLGANDGSGQNFTATGEINGWQILSSAGTDLRIDFASASAGWTNWLTCTNLLVPSSPYLFLDDGSFSEPSRVYRTTSNPDPSSSSQISPTAP
jgi:hypothetical protein